MYVKFKNLNPTPTPLPKKKKSKNIGKLPLTHRFNPQSPPYNLHKETISPLIHGICKPNGSFSHGYWSRKELDLMFQRSLL